MLLKKTSAKNSVKSQNFRVFYTRHFSIYKIFWRPINTYNKICSSLFILYTRRHDKDERNKTCYRNLQIWINSSLGIRPYTSTFTCANPAFFLANTMTLVTVLYHLEWDVSPKFFKFFHSCYREIATHAILHLRKCPDTTRENKSVGILLHLQPNQASNIYFP